MTATRRLQIVNNQIRNKQMEIKSKFDHFNINVTNLRT